MKKLNHPSLLHKILVTGGLLAILLIFILSTDPHTIALPLIIVPFLLIGLVTYQLVRIILTLRTPKSSFTYKIVPLMVAFMGVLLLLLASLHQLTWKDTLLLALFGILFWLYIWRADFLK